MNVQTQIKASEKPPAFPGRKAIAWLVVAHLLAAACAVGAQLLTNRTSGELAMEARRTAESSAALLRTEIEKYRALPIVLSQDEDIRAALAAPRSMAVRDLDRKLGQIASEIALNAIYVLDLQGFGIATGSSPTELRKFCTKSCAKRAYFQDALRQGYGQFFSLGRPNQRAGMYFSHLMTTRTGEPLGVVVAKVQFVPIQNRWRELGNPTFVADEHGVVVISSNPSWIGKTVGPLDPALRQRLIRSAQFGILPLAPLPFDVRPAARGPIQVRLNLEQGQADERAVVVTTPLAQPGWRLYLFRPADRALNHAALIGASMVFLTGILIITLATAASRSYNRRRAEFLREVSTRQELEKRVAERTRALSSANAKLLSEMEERRRIEGDLHRMQDDLVQANKLAALGQIAAGVAHEINQPLAAIRTFASNGRKMMKRGQIAEAEANFTVIDELTGRIKRITDELRAFSRRRPRVPDMVSIEDAISGALRLIHHRLPPNAVTVLRTPLSKDLVVRAERIRLEQILVNLLQNALDALEGQSDPKIELGAQAEGELVQISVADNGPGLSEAAMAALFMPFSTTKPNGLGLGLVICREIAVELGGELRVESSPRGATFTLVLKSPVPENSSAGIAKPGRVSARGRGAKVV